MRFILKRQKTENDNTNNLTNINNNNNLKKILIKSRYQILMRISFMLITPIISYCGFFAWKHYKKTRKLIDEYIEAYLNNLKNKIKKFKDKIEKERIKNCEENLNRELDLYEYFDLDICMEIIHLKNEINKRFIDLNYSNLIISKLNSIKNDSLDEYLCVHKEIRRKIKQNQKFIYNLIEDKLEINIDKVIKKINKEKEFLLDLNDSIMIKDFFTRQKFQEANKFDFLDFLNLRNILNYFTFRNKFDNNNLQLTENDNKNNKVSANIDIDLASEEEEFEYTINNKLIRTYCAAFYSFSNNIREKLTELLENNNIDIIDPININRDLNKMTICIIEFNYESIIENYRVDMRNVFHALILNRFFHNNRVIHCFDELKSFLNKFKISLLE